MSFKPRLNNSEAKHRTNFSWCMGFIIVLSLMYFFLLGPINTFLSLSYLLDIITELPPHEQLLAMSLIPIYLSLLIFGGGIIGGMLGTWLQKHLRKTEKRIDS